jgi:hypothetical protein
MQVLLALTKTTYTTHNPLEKKNNNWKFINALAPRANEITAR